MKIFLAQLGIQVKEDHIIDVKLIFLMIMPKFKEHHIQF